MRAEATGREPEQGAPPAATLGLVVAVVAVSWAAILIRLAAPAPPLAIAFWRLALACILLMPLAWLGRRARPGAEPASSLLILGAGGLLAAHFALWIASLFLTSIASSVMLVSTQPLFAVFIAGPMLGEPPRRRTWGAVALSLSGAIAISAGDHAAGPGAVLGDLMALAAAGAAAVYLLLGRRARQGGALPAYLLKVNGVAAAVLLVLCLATGARLWGYSSGTWAALAGLAAGPHLAGHGLLNLAVRFFPAPAVNLALAGEPILSTAYGAWLFDEIPRASFYGGSLLVLAGLGLEFVPALSRRTRA